MPTPLHQELKSLAGPRPAAYLSIRLVNSLVISRFTQAIAKLAGVEFILGQQRLLAATVVKAEFSVPPGPNAIFLRDANNPNSDSILLSLQSDLTVITKLYIKGDQTKLISTATVVIKNVTVNGSYRDNALLFESTDFLSVPTIVRDNNADATLKAAGVTDLLEAARLEGLIAYGAIPEVLKQTLGQARHLNLADVYPAFDLGKRAKLFPVQAGKLLAIVPASFSINPNAICGCSPGIPLGSSATTSTILVPPNPQNGPLSGQVSLGGPVPQNIDPMRDLGARPADKDGWAGVYMPQSTYEGLTVKIMPAIEIEASDNGFIGFDARATVGFSNPTVSLDLPRGGIVLDFDLDISVSATCTLDMICFRLPIGRAIFNPVSGSQAHLTMGFYPAVDVDGTVKLRSILQKADMGKYVAVVIGVGTALEVIGITAWLGFLIDVVLSTVLSLELPSTLKSQISKYLSNNEWVLLHFGDLLKQSFPVRNPEFSAPFDIDANSLLASVDYRERG